MLDHKIDIFVSASRKVDQYGPDIRFLCQFQCIGYGMCGFDGRDDPFCSGEFEECVDRFFIADGRIIDTVDIFEVGMLRSDRRVVQTAGNRVDLLWLTLFILKHVRFEAVHHARFPQCHCCSILTRNVQAAS